MIQTKCPRMNPNRQPPNSLAVGVSRRDPVRTQGIQKQASPSSSLLPCVRCAIPTSFICRFPSKLSTLLNARDQKMMHFSLHYILRLTASSTAEHTARNICVWIKYLKRETLISSGSLLTICTCGLPRDPRAQGTVKQELDIVIEGF